MAMIKHILRSGAVLFNPAIISLNLASKAVEKSQLANSKFLNLHQAKLLGYSKILDQIRAVVRQSVPVPGPAVRERRDRLQNPKTGPLSEIYSGILPKIKKRFVKVRMEDADDDGDIFS